LSKKIDISGYWIIDKIILEELYYQAKNNPRVGYTFKEIVSQDDFYSISNENAKKRFNFLMRKGDIKLSKGKYFITSRGKRVYKLLK